MAAIIVHFITFCYFTIKLVMVLQDAYSENFIMDAISKRKIIYNISWEDPAIDHQVLHTGKGDVVLTISSAGCNALDYLVQGADAVVAADLNEAQLATLELKLAGLKTLTHDEFFAIWGESDYAVFQKVYKSKLRSQLSPETKSFWDENDILIRDNFMYAGTSGLMAYIMSFPARFFGIKKHMESLTGVAPKGPFTNLTLYITRAILSRYWIWSWLAPLGGVPLSQLQLIERNPAVFCDRILQICERDMWTKDNYFYFGYITGKFAKNCCPRYLEAQYFDYLKANAHRVLPFKGTWAEAAQTRNDFTVYSLLDSMDWMPHQMVADNIGRIIPQMNREKGRIFWRSFSPDVHSPALAHLRPRLVPDVDRVGWYMSQFVVDKIPANFDASKLMCPLTDSYITNSFMGDLKVMAIMAFYGLFNKEKDSVEFYRRQGREYDSFREALLPDRDNLLRHVVPWTTCPKTWVSVGCGTARDIEYVVQHIVSTSTQVYLVDLSPALLEVAKERVARLDLGKQCHIIEGDITSKEILGKLPKQGSVDLVTCSYCLTMIPPWEDACKAMVKLLKEGGHFALVDFTEREGCVSDMKQRFYKWWFAHDGVWLNHEQPAWLRKNLKTVWYSEAESRLPYTTFYPSHYMFCGEKAK
jgi:S-adenosylmethionine:diacylglycerol 3-amino-3-carboxypropyl transferase/ubiquinone/menaquinone biosynthesis C-methylase UbiE